MTNIIRTLAKVTLAGVFAVSSATAVIATQAANPAQPNTANDAAFISGSALPASAAWGPDHHHGRYAWHGRYWEHRRWHGGYWDRFHRWHTGFWVYF